MGAYPYTIHERRREMSVMSVERCFFKQKIALKNFLREKLKLLNLKCQGMDTSRELLL